ncbi:MAG: NAD-dependent protein deacylase [Enterococcus viikkiensis]|uniref:protein acetyllysine N-acetyltransferase n=1 Tax=Enterococcus viikkiensis TaxID=930854 RepID=A0ABU3FQC6_9ENTE|nr:NAD-dependent protein deacylase [Enterococcus viikkiensis]MDT2827843.1 NAD-dependent protein deacylase [Enterococcus viikkiensis]
MEITIDQGVQMIQAAQKITFLTGAGVSTPSGVPDYRSLQGVYQGLEAPEYLLSNDCLVNEPQKFYEFVKHLYHEEAKPNVIHQMMVKLEAEKEVWIVSQNIDGLHAAAGSQHLVNFHGSLYDCYCRNCQQPVAWQEYLQSDRHKECGGQIRPNIVLYGEGFEESVIQQAIYGVEKAELVVIVGTSFQVHPFCDLIYEKSSDANVLVINQTPIQLAGSYDFIQTNGVAVFEKL